MLDLMLHWRLLETNLSSLAGFPALRVGWRALLALPQSSQLSGGLLPAGQANRRANSAMMFVKCPAETVPDVAGAGQCGAGFPEFP